MASLSDDGAQAATDVAGFAHGSPLSTAADIQAAIADERPTRRAARQTRAAASGERMRTVLITGTSAGFGLLATVELATRGWRVIATMRNLDRKGPLEAALAQSGAARNVDIVQLDVTDAASISKGVAETLAITGGFLDAVVHNAGVATGGAFEDIPDAELRRVMETNLFGVMALTRALLPTFRKQRSGRIVDRLQRGRVRRPAVQFDLRRPRSGRWRAGRNRSPSRSSSSASRCCSSSPGPYITDIWQASPRFSPDGQRLPAVGAVPVPRHRRARRRQGRRSAGGRGAASPTCWRRRDRASAIRSAARRASFTSRAGKFPSRWLRRGFEAYLGSRRVRL